MKTKVKLCLAFMVTFLFTNLSRLNAQWVQVNNGITNLYVRSLAVKANNLFAGTNGNGVFLSTNNGATWTQAGLNNDQVQSLAFSGGTLFAGTNGNGVFLSTDNGTHWTPANTGLTNQSITSIYPSGSYIYVGTYGGGIFCSSNNGTNWVQINTGLQTLNINTFATCGNYLFAGGTGLYRSSDDGLTWNPVGPFTNAWVHTLAVLGSDIYAGTEGQYIYRSTDNGNTWTQIGQNNGLQSSIIQSLNVIGTSIFAGTNGGVYLSTDNGQTWSHTGLQAIAFSFAQNGQYIFAGTGFTTGVYRRPLLEMMQVVNVTITSDNAYVYGFGDVNGIIDYHYPGVCNYLAHEIYSPNTGPETYTIAGNLSGKYIYIAAWSDEAVYQGTIAQFSDGNTTVVTTPTLPNPYVHWEVYATGIDLDPHSSDPEPIAPYYIPRRNSNAPSLSEINQQIAIANANAGNPQNTSVGWVSTTPIPGRVGVLAFGPNNIGTNGFPPQTVSGIVQNAQWMWYNPEPINITNPFVTGSIPNFPADKSREYYIFRVGPLDSIFTSCDCINPPTGMVGWWTMDETSGTIAHDIAGFPNDGTCTNCPTPLSGKVDGALHFFGNNYFEVSNHNELDFGRGDFSIDAWIETGNCKEGTISPIVDKYDPNTNVGYVFYLTQNPVGSLFLNININGTTYTSTTPFQISNQWIHVAVTVRRNVSSPFGTFYINGNSVGNFTLPSGPPVTNSVNLWIGNSRISQQKCPVTIDELELFNRYLDATEVHSIWAADSCGKCKHITDVRESERIPEKFELMQSFPNPFNPTTIIRFSIPIQEHVTLKVFNILGRELATLVNEELTPGTYERTFDAQGLASGIYFYRLQAGSFVETKKLVLLR